MVYKGDHPPHTGNVLYTRAIFVLICSGFERLAYYTITGSQTVYFIRVMGMESILAQEIQAVYQAFVYMLPIAGALIADTVSGRYIISVSCLAIAAVGAVGLLAGTYWKVKWLAMLMMFAGFGAPVAMVKPNLIVLGGDQFNEKVESQLAQRNSFFNGIYWITNIAAMTAFFVFNQIAVEGMGAITKDMAFNFVFLMGAIWLICSSSSIFFGSKCLFAPKPKGSPLGPLMKITFDALKRPPTMQGYLVLLGLFGPFICVIVSIPGFFMKSKVYPIVMGAIILVCCAFCFVFGRSADWIDHVKRHNPPRFTKVQVQAVKDVYRLTPFFATAIPFWAAYNQMNTSFISAGCQMNPQIGSATFSPTTLSAYNCALILIFIPIFMTIVYPGLQKFKGGLFCATPIRRIGAGMAVAGIAMLIGAILEIERKKAPLVYVTCTQKMINDHDCSNLGATVTKSSSCYDNNIPIRDYNILWQIIPYGVVGISEILVAISFYDFFYSQVPPFIRAVCQAIQFLTVALGTMVGAVINSICDSLGWLPNNLDDGHLEYMLFFNMAFCWFFMAVLYFVSKDYEYKKGTSLRLEDNEGNDWDLISSDGEEDAADLAQLETEPKADQELSEELYYYSEEVKQPEH